ncbi:MAG TPA: branched-chain amino acid ABC transporter permease [Acidimicrobiia bacterium]|nr:branched-chain amino acid ABC transporter permease [Acidimicrobiia bacterium]
MTGIAAASGLGKRRWWVSIGLTAMLASVLLSSLPVSAQEGETITTQLRVENDEGERIGVENVRLFVTTEDEEEIGEAETDADGVFTFVVPTPGTYLLTIDEGTLPAGVYLRDPSRTTASVNVLPGQGGRALFALSPTPPVDEEGGVLGGSRGFSARALAQLSTEGLKLGLFLAMAAIGLSLIFGTTGLVNFAHGEMIGWGMLFAYFFNVYGFAGAFGFLSGLPPPFGGGVNLIFAIMIATVFGALLGYAMDKIVFAPLRRRGVSLIAQLVVTIGISIFLRYVYLFAYGGVPRFYRDYTAQSGIPFFGGFITITPKDLITGSLSLLILIGVGAFLTFTRTGKAMRAVADNRDLAESSGIDVQKVIRFVWVSGGALAALGGAFLGLSEVVGFNTGFRFLLLIFAGVILGGLGTAYGALIGCLIVGVGIQVSTLFIPTELKNVGALAVLIVVLVIRPQGIMGRRERIG